VDDSEYFAARECEERALAKVAPNAQVRDIHLLLAAKYAALAAGQTNTPENGNAEAGQIQTAS
jgi:hypothetical protein